MKIIRKFLDNPYKLISWIVGNVTFIGHNLSDEKYISIMYRGALGKRPNLENPETFNEKIQWLKLHDRNPLYVNMVDKYEVKKYVAGIIGEKHIIPTLGVWDRFEDINFDELPNQFVIKCTHDSGGWLL